ncbi:hypothetical protein, partial [Methylovirgula sp. 4M-Z18]|uniref:hypothetical protein n=1 Tax=Methylovirgula sp. 4M-Z18 TaxID=2293567 RepID=UPI001AECEB39
AFRQFAKLVGRGDRIEQGRLQAFRQGNLLKVHVGMAPSHTSFLHQIGYIRQFGAGAVQNKSKRTSDKVTNAHIGRGLDGQSANLDLHLRAIARRTQSLFRRAKGQFRRRDPG